MVEVILLQVPFPIWEALWVGAAYHHDRIVYAKHVLLHSLILLSDLSDLIQGPYHGIILALVTKCLLHVHQQVPHGDILAFIQCAGPFARVPTETVENVGAHACLIILLKKGVHIKAPECIHHFCPWISQLKERHIQSRRCQPLLLPTPSVALHLCWWPAVSLAVEYPLESGAPLSGEEGGEPSLPTTVHWDLGSLLCSCTAPVWEVSLALATSSTLEALPACCGTLPTSWLKESDSPAFTTGILWPGFSAWPLSLLQSEAATAHHHTSIRGKRLMVKWAEHEIHCEKVCSMQVWITCVASCLKPRWPCLS